MEEECEALKEQNFEFVTMQGDPKGITRALWVEIFSTDTKQFLDYYYKYKAPEAWVYLLKEHGQIVSMLHLNPYDVYCNGLIRSSYYIVAVATSKEHRHKGCMRRLLRAALTDAKEWGCPFLFLMPADPAIYEPFGFQYVYTHQAYVPADERVAEAIRKCVREKEDIEFIRQEQRYRLCSYSVTATGDHKEELSVTELAQKELAARYRTFCIHDRAYFNRLQQELRSENGDLLLVYKDTKDGEVFVGYICYANEGAEAYQEVVLIKETADLFVPYKRSDAIMALALNGERVEGPCYFPEIV